MKLNPKSAVLAYFNRWWLPGGIFAALSLAGAALSLLWARVVTEPGRFPGWIEVVDEPHGMPVSVPLLDTVGGVLASCFWISFLGILLASVWHLYRRCWK